jgi:hypothetical protein
MPRTFGLKKTAVPSVRGWQLTPRLETLFLAAAAAERFGGGGKALGKVGA